MQSSIKYVSFYDYENMIGKREIVQKGVPEHCLYNLKEKQITASSETKIDQRSKPSKSSILFIIELKKITFVSFRLLYFLFKNRISRHLMTSQGFLHF